MRVLTICVSAAALAISSGAIAAPEKASGAKPKTEATADVGSVKKSIPDLQAMFALFDKLFPPQPDPDPARLALARTSVQAMWPDGAYGNMMIGFMGGIFDRVMQMKGSDFAAFDDKTKKTDASLAAAKDQSLHDLAAAKDPYFDQRMAAMRAVMTEEAGKVSQIIDPRMRDGLARSMARHFDARQLTDINGFFATPTGHAFASQYMQLWLDPDTMRSVMGTVPEMVKLMPEMMQKVQAANDKFPKPPKPADKADKK